MTSSFTDPPAPLGEKGRFVIERLLKTFPEMPGVYRMLGDKGQALYVGKAKNLKKRVAAYTQPDRLPLRLQRMVSETVSMEIVTTHTEAEAFLLEANLIKKLMPRYNILLRDGKTLAYIALTQHAWPLLTKHRGKQEDKAQYFGPFASVEAVMTTLTALHRAFLLRSCSDTVFKTRQRPCLQYHIKRCSAPCVGKITQEAYQNLVQQAIDVLNGRSQRIQETLAEEMQRASTQQDYERAALLRDRIRALTHIQSHQLIHIAHLQEADIAALYQEGGRSCVQMFFFRKGSNYGAQAFFPKHDPQEESAAILQAFLGQFYTDSPAPPLLLLSHPLPEAALFAQAFAEHAGVTLQVPQRGPKKLLLDHALANAQQALSRHLSERTSQREILEKMVDIFDLSQIPQRIEVYDNSHLQGTHAIGAMIVAGPEGFMKAAYRKFNIKGEIAPGDDFGMMREVFTRRFKKPLEHDADAFRENWPDLVMIDGGKGQLSAAQAVFDDLGITDIKLVAIAKGPHRNAGQETFYRPHLPPLKLEENHPVLHYLQRLRDEAHRYVINAHRHKRTKALHHRRLEDIPGVGSQRKRALLNHFGSFEAVKQAGVEDLKKVAGVSLSLAQKIYAACHEFNNAP